MSNVRNPFRNADRRREFDAVVRAFNKKDRVLFAHTRAGVIDPSGAPAGRANNGWASAFWAGYDGMTHGVRVPEPGAISFPWYVAGRALRPTTK